MDKLEKLAKQLTDSTTHMANLYTVNFYTIDDDHIVRSSSVTVAADDIAEVIDVVGRHVDVNLDDDLGEIVSIERNGSVLIDLRRWNYEREELEESA